VDTVWASLLAWNLPKLSFDYFIYLDGLCNYWPEDNLWNNTIVQDYYRSLQSRYLGQSRNPATFATFQFWACLAPGDVNHVVPWNVHYALEVRSNNGLPNYTWDGDVSVRTDGREHLHCHNREYGRPQRSDL
jgi:hypothetical protein